MKLREAKKIAERIRSILAPHCERCEIAGSIRRMKPEPNDIEIVCIPQKAAGLFAMEGRSAWWQRRSIPEIGERLKGFPIENRYIQFMLPEGIKLDLFTATRDNWGLIFAIRTGSAEFSHHVLATGWVRAGYQSKNGLLSKNGANVPVREEIDLFNLIGIPFVDPQERI